MPLWCCGWDTCQQPAVQRAGDCLLCDKHLCATHLQKPWHKCPDPEVDWESYCVQYTATEAAHLDELSNRIDGDALCLLASSLRAGIPCKAEVTRKTLSAMMGNQNCHIEVTFQDGVQWVARFRLTKTSSPPREIRDYILQSEAATMIYLQQRTQIPTPEIFHWAAESDPTNSLGAGYILMEKVDGQPLSWESSSPKQREKVMQQLADIYLEIEKHPFDAMGSILGDFKIHGLADPGLFRRESGGPLGPFTSSLEGMQAILESYLDMIVNGEIAATNQINVYLAHRFRLEAIFENVFLPDNQFFLKHPDDKGDHILVNDSFDITGIIDWEWTQVVSKEQAFSSPCMMWPVEKFYDGQNDLAEEEVRLAAILKERGREDLSKYILGGRKVQRLGFGIGPEGSFSNEESFVNLFAGLRKTFDPCDDIEWEQWKVSALRRWKSDEISQLLLNSPSKDLVE